MPPSIQRSNAKHYKAKTTVTEHEEFAGPHLLPAREGWEEVADFALDWAVAHAVVTAGSSAPGAATSGTGVHMGTVRVTHLGGPITLIEFAGWRLLTDPTFDPPGRTYHFGWGSASRKLTGPAIDAAVIGPIDAVLLTHDHHADNLDDAGRDLLPSAGAVVTTTSGAARLGHGARGLEPWAVTRLERPGSPPIEVTATPCRHGPPLTRPLTGDVIRFALRWDGQDHGVLWISADTVLYNGVREVADRFDVGLALLHLGHARFSVTGPLRYSMSAKNAVDLCRLVRPRTAVPVHYEGWSHFRQGHDAIKRDLADAPADIRDRFQLLTVGAGSDIPI